MDSLNKMIKIALIDDSHIYREAFRKFITVQKNMSLVGNIGINGSIKEFCLNLRPDIVFLAIPYERQRGILLAEELVRSYPGIKIICMGIFVSPSAVNRLLKAGCSRYIEKDFEANQIEKIIRDVLIGQTFTELKMAI